MPRHSERPPAMPPGRDPVDESTLPIMSEQAAAELESLNAELFGDADTLTDDRIVGFTWQIWRLPPAGTPLPQGVKPGQGEFMCKVAGPLDLERIRSLVGGGVYRVIGSGRDADGMAKRFVQTFQIAGTPKSPPAPESLTPTTGVVTPNAAAPASSLEAKLDRLIELQLAGARAPQGDPMDRAIDLVVKLSAITNRGGGQQSEAVLAGMIGMLQKGIELGTVREPSEGSEWVEALKAVAPTLNDTLKAVFAPRPVVARPAPRPPRPAEATVVDPAAAGAPAVDDNALRMGMIVDTLARAMARGRDPEDLAASLEDLLTDDEMGLLRMSTVDYLEGQLTPHRERFPIFATPGARGYLERLLAAITHQDADDDGEAGPTVQ